MDNNYAYLQPLQQIKVLCGMSSFPIKYSSRRTQCPKCEARHAWAAILEYGNSNVEGLGYGVCKACGFLHTPKHERKEWKKESFVPPTIHSGTHHRSLQERCFVRADVWQSTLLHTPSSHFVQFACRTFGDAFLQHLELWGVGGDAWGAIVWNYFDWQGRCCTMKTMPYNAETGKRVKEGLAWRDNKTGESITASAVNGIRTRFDAASACSSFQWFTKSKGYELCLYGEQWLSVKPQASVILVESEKTAVIGSFIFPDYVWLASGGTNGLTKEKAMQLRGRTVLVCFDAEEKAIFRAQQTVALLCSIGAAALDRLHGEPIVYALLGEENTTGKDIADELIDYFCANPSALLSVQEQNRGASNHDENDDNESSFFQEARTMILLPAWLDRYEFEERVAIIELDAGISRQEAEEQALRYYAQERSSWLAHLSELDAAICETFSATAMDEEDEDYIFIAEL